MENNKDYYCIFIDGIVLLKKINNNLKMVFKIVPRGPKKFNAVSGKNIIFLKKNNNRKKTGFLIYKAEMFSIIAPK